MKSNSNELVRKLAGLSRVSRSDLDSILNFEQQQSRFLAMGLCGEILQSQDLLTLKGTKTRYFYREAAVNKEILFENFDYLIILKGTTDTDSTGLERIPLSEVKWLLKIKRYADWFSFKEVISADLLISPAHSEFTDCLSRNVNKSSLKNSLLTFAPQS